MRSVKCLAISALALVVFILAIQANSVSAEEVQGTVKNALETPLPETRVSLKNPAGEIVKQTLSDTNGHFVFSGVAPGNYTVLAEKSGFQSSTAIVSVADGKSISTALTLSAQEALEMSVAAKRLSQARNTLSPKTGGSVFRFDQSHIDALPGGVNTPLNQVLLQAPGVSNDSFGQIHIRGDHSNIQYRINGIMLPDGISGFGQALDTRFIDKLDLLTGSLPAQYGYRTAGVVEVKTKTQYETGGRVELYGGSRNTIQPGVEYGGSTENMTYFMANTYLTNNIGIENTTSSVNPLHDRTEQNKGFGYMSYTLNPTNRLTVMFGSYDGWFQIPNRPGQPADSDGRGFLAGAGITGFDSATLHERQYENNRYGIVAWQSSIGSAIDTQLSFFSRTTRIRFTPDSVGDLVFNGIASDVLRSSFSNGVQSDTSYRANETHTIRMGFFASTEDVENNNTSTVFPVDGNGNVSGSAFTIRDGNSKNGNTLFGIYLQDEWRALDKLTVNYGLRFDRMDAFVTEDQVSPRLGMVYKATPQTSLHAAYARYFTPPRNSSIAPGTPFLFTNTSNAPANNLNSPVLPERSHYFDVGATHTFTPALSVGVDGFYKKVTDLLDEGRFGQALIYTPFNYTDGKVYGVEFTGNYRVGDLNAYANLARTISLAKNIGSGQFNFDQDQLNYISNNWIRTDHSQTYTASAGISYRWLGTQYLANATYGSGLRRGFANTEQMPYNFQLNLGAAREFKLGDFGPVVGRLSLLNALDHINSIRDGTGIGVGAPQFGPRLGVFAGISKQF